MNTAKTYYQRGSENVARKVAGEMLVVPLSRNIADMQHIFTLNAVGEFIWELLAEQRDFESLVDHVVSEFDVNAEIAEGDCRAFLESLLERKLISERVCDGV